MKNALRILAAVTGVLTAVSEVLIQANKYLEYKKQSEISVGPEKKTTDE